MKFLILLILFPLSIVLAKSKSFDSYIHVINSRSQALDADDILFSAEYEVGRLR